ncbi:hypothetical protein [Roseibium sp. RKSG952]|uniref:hypothetical protein n=1 Tax=Roseibium sp. RKSG952 TaxID=2529384 RepID=UPI0012BB705E|nr:hypothetical protein [Roseibium sp. RKSG952]MTH94665.1 hypothetical protein [Roseibium sp. RKSG952]
MHEAVAATPSEIGDAVAYLRQSAERSWANWHASSSKPKDPFRPDSQNMCGFTASFVSLALPDIVGGKWQVAGGWPQNGGGVISPSGETRAHFWSVSKCGLVVDITGDQFGLPSVIVTTRADNRYRASFCSEFLKMHLPKVIPVAVKWLEELSLTTDRKPTVH